MRSDCENVRRSSTSRWISSRGKIRDISLNFEVNLRSESSEWTESTARWSSTFSATNSLKRRLLRAWRHWRNHCSDGKGFWNRKRLAQRMTSTSMTISRSQRTGWINRKWRCWPKCFGFRCLQSLNRFCKYIESESILNRFGYEVVLIVLKLSTCYCLQFGWCYVFYFTTYSDR